MPIRLFHKSGRYLRALTGVAAGIWAASCASTPDLPKVPRAPGESAPPDSETAALPAPAPVPAGPVVLSVQDALLGAMERNRALVVERLTPAIRKTFEAEQNGAFDTTLSGEYTQSRIEAERLATSGVGLEAYDADETKAGLSARKAFATGTAVELLATANSTDSSLAADAFGAARVGITVSQSLLRGFGPAANLAAIRQAEIDTAMSVNELQAFAESLVIQVEKTYWDLVLARRQLQIVEDSLKLAERHRDETDERVKIGKLAPTEHVAAEAEVALRREQLLAERSNEETTRLKLLRLVNLPGERLALRELTLTTEPQPPDPAEDALEEHVAVALRQRPDLKEAALRLERGDIELVRTRNGLLPKLDFFVTLGGSGYANSFGGAWDNLDAERQDVKAGVRFEYPLGDRGAGAKHERALLGRRQLAGVYSNVVQLAELDVCTAWIEARRTREQIAATAATRRLQEEKLRVEDEKYRVDKSTALLVAQAQRDLMSSQMAEVRARVNHLKALSDLYRADGSLLHRRGIATPAAP